MGKKTDLESVHLVNHSKCMLAAFQNFRQDETMLDVTLVCNGMSLKAHKLVLSACSPFFKELFTENPCTHPIIILRDFDFTDLKAIVDFVYKGELSVPRERLMSALKVAEELHIRGLRRSEPKTEKYEKLYNQVCGKLTGRKKRKRHRQNSSDSEEYVNISDSDHQNIVESDESLSATGEAPVESQQMDVESVEVEENITNDKDIRPVVLRVGDPSVCNEEQISEKAVEDEECNVVTSAEKNLSEEESHIEQMMNTSQIEQIEGEIIETISEEIASSSHFDSVYISACPENSAMVYVEADEESGFQVEESMEPIAAAECSEEGGFISSSCLSPKSPKGEQQENETKLPDEGKRFICSKCDSVFTSRINFMRHKALGHNACTKPNVEKSSYKCQDCSFTTEELDCFKSHLLTHSDRVPYQCSKCPEQFTSEELYQKHLSLHEVEEIALRGLSPSSGQDLLTQNKNSEKNLEYRCSICFTKFSSKLRCQFHEKACQGGS